MAPPNALQIVGILSVVLLIGGGGAFAFEFKVGGPRSSWTVPTDHTVAIYNQWAEKSRFQIGDTLLFEYDGSHDSVLHVTKEDYNNCNTESPIEKFNDGHTVFHLSQSGPYYFISGAAENCRKNEKLVVVVMADRTKHKSDDAAPPPPSPADETPSEDDSPPNNGAVSTVSTAAAVLSGFLIVLAI